MASFSPKSLEILAKLPAALAAVDWEAYAEQVARDEPDTLCKCGVYVQTSIMQYHKC